MRVEEDVVPWLREKAREHKTPRLWATFLLEDYPLHAQRVFLDEYMEMTNGTVKQNLGRIVQSYTVNLPPICNSRRTAVEEVDDRFYPSYNEPDLLRVLTRARGDAIGKAKEVLDESFAFTIEGKEQLR